MVYGRGETWFWRLIGICALSVCALNLMVLLRTNGRLQYAPEGSEASKALGQAITKPLSSTGHSVSITASHTSTETKATHGQPTTLQTQPEQWPIYEQKQDNSPAKAANVPGYLKKPVWPDVLKVGKFFNPNEILLLGRRRPKKSYLVIGIPTVKRNKAFYLLDTLKGLIHGTTPQEREHVVMVVFVADDNQAYRKFVRSTVLKEFKNEVERGVIQIIVAPPRYYPPLHELPPLYGDSPERVRWRSKQSLDYSFLYYYCSDLAQYYLQLEDDVLTEQGYYNKIQQYINAKSKTNWSTLEFGARGFIGMMYRGENLVSLARFTRFYFWTMPIDWIFRIYNDIFLHGNTHANIRKPPLFKHIGTYSSLDGQVRKLEDISLGRKEQKILHVLTGKTNPPASLDTTIREIVPGHSISEAYSKGYFWGKTILPGSKITITFHKKCKVSRIAFLSGSPRYPSDALDDGDILVSTLQDCSRFELLHSFHNTIDVDIKSIQINEPLQCIQLKINTVRMDDHRRKRWLIIREIGIWTL